MALTDDIEEGETLLIIGAVALGAWLLYQFYDDIVDFINSLFGVSQGAGTYTNAATQSLQHPITTLESIIGLNQGTSSSTTGGPANLPTGGSSATAYSKIGASGQMWNCTGPSGASNDVCFPVDSSGNATGPAVQAANAN
jgi:hypothetical protein